MNIAILYGAEEMSGALHIMATDILARDSRFPVLIGIRRGGLPPARRLARLMGEKCGRTPEIGVIDINLYRDDWTRARALPKVGRTDIPFNLDDQRVILVDDVLYTGRTVRAALEALAEFGRPARVELAVMVDRGHREMPVEAGYAPFRIRTRRGERVNVVLAEEAGGEDRITLESGPDDSPED